MLIPTYLSQPTITDMLQRVSNKEVRGLNFMVFVPNIHQVRYTENGRVATVEIEGGIGKDGEVNWLVYRETLRGWGPPHEMDEMSSEKRGEILSRISESLTMLEMPHELA